MAVYFLDTSALSKRYHVEEGTERVEGLFREGGALRIISHLTVVETQSVFARKVKSGEITHEVFWELVLNRLFRDLREGRVRVIQMSNAVYDKAGSLIQTYGRKEAVKRFRALDALQLATAVIWSELAPLDHFVSADKELATVAEMEGFSVINPEVD